VTLHRRRPGTAVLALLSLFALPAGAEVIDQILVHVNGRIVTQSQLDDRVRAVLAEAPPDLDQGRRDDIRKAALKELVDEALLEDRARDLDLVATDAEVEEQVKHLKEQNGIASEEEFVRALSASNLTPARLREQLKRTSTIQRVVGREVNSRVDLSDDALFWAAECWTAQKKYREALGTLERLLKEYPQSDKASSAHLRKGLAHLELGEKAQAIVQLQFVVHEYPTSDEAKSARQRLRSLGSDSR
jgi:peptidyl-prolyl cis-trans isomerase SurA